jgi:hypothetical protein
MFYRASTSEVKGRKVVSFTIDNSRSAEVPLGPIFDGINWPNTLAWLEEFRATNTDVEEYGDEMLAGDERIVPKDFVVKSLKLMKLHNCTGAYRFLEACLADHLLKNPTYLYLACPIPLSSSNDNSPIDGFTPTEYIARFAFTTLLETGCLKQLQYFTVAFRSDSGYCTEPCHLQVPTRLTECVGTIARRR